MPNWENWDDEQWASEFKKLIIEHLQRMGHDVGFDNIQVIGVNMEDALLDFDIKELDVPVLARIYALSIMSENYEQANAVKEELGSRGCEINIIVNKDGKEGILDIKFRPQTGVQHIKMKMTLTRNGVTFEDNEE